MNHVTSMGLRRHSLRQAQHRGRGSDVEGVCPRVLLAVLFKSELPVLLVVPLHVGSTTPVYSMLSATYLAPGEHAWTALPVGCCFNNYIFTPDVNQVVATLSHGDLVFNQWTSSETNCLKEECHLSGFPSCRLIELHTFLLL